MANIIEAITDSIDEAANYNPFFVATWVSTESVDSNLSIIQSPRPNLITGTDLIRFVPKAAHVTGLVAGDTVICITKPLAIFMVLVGDVTLAEI